jgi:hypothetical protein
LGYRSPSVPNCVRIGESDGLQNHIRAHMLINGSIEAGLGLALLNAHIRRATVGATVA